MTATHEDGSTDKIQLNHTLNPGEIEWFKDNVHYRPAYADLMLQTIIAGDAAQGEDPRLGGVDSMKMERLECGRYQSM